jgi:transposase InsO family protein
MPISCQADPHIGINAVNYPALMAIRCLGLDILGSFPQTVGGYQYLYVAIDKFTKWPEATPMVNINKQSTVNFIKSIVGRFGVLNRIFTDNGS